MSNVHFIDTSVLVELLNIPNMNSHHRKDMPPILSRCFKLFGSGENNHFGSGENNQF